MDGRLFETLFLPPFFSIEYIRPMLASERQCSVKVSPFWFSNHHQVVKE
jgi:hypothetical protein